VPVRQRHLGGGPELEQRALPPGLLARGWA
jgi:hypothetical protein